MKALVNGVSGFAAAGVMALVGCALYLKGKHDGVMLMTRDEVLPENAKHEPARKEG